MNLSIEILKEMTDRWAALVDQEQYLCKKELIAKRVYEDAVVERQIVSTQAHILDRRIKQGMGF